MIAGRLKFMGKPSFPQPSRQSSSLHRPRLQRKSGHLRALTPAWRIDARHARFVSSKLEGVTPGASPDHSPGAAAIYTRLTIACTYM
jgi:hypothetical protein